MEISEYARSFRAHWKAIAAATMLCLLLAFGISAALPKVYTASALIFVTTEANASSSYENSQFTLQRVKSYPNLVDSPSVLNPVILELGLDENISDLRTRITATNPIETVYVKVTATSAVPNDASRLANSVAKYLTQEIKAIDSHEVSTDITVKPVVAVPAVAPTAPTFPNTKVNLALGGLIGLATGMVLALVKTRFSRKIYDGMDVQIASGLKVMGSLTRDRETLFRVPRPWKTGPIGDTLNPFFELWTNILVTVDGQLPQIVVLAPAGPEALARSDRLRRDGANFLSDAGHKVCYVEADGAASPAFDRIDELPGLLQVLADEATTAEASHRVFGTLVTVMPSGKHLPSLSEAIPSRQTGTVLKELADQYDVVLVQGGLGHGPTSANTLAPIANAVLVVAVYGVTTKNQIRQAALEMKSIGVKPLGVVIVETPNGRTLSGNLADEPPWQT